MRTKRLSDRAFALRHLVLAGLVLLVTAAILLGIVDGSQPYRELRPRLSSPGRTGTRCRRCSARCRLSTARWSRRFIALLLAGLVGVGAAIFLAEIAPGLVRTPLSFMVELLAAIPSIVYGVWGMFVLAPFLRSDVVPGLKAGRWAGPGCSRDHSTALRC